MPSHSRGNIRSLYPRSNVPKAQSRTVGSIADMTTEMLVCRDLRHKWEFKTDNPESFVYHAGRLVRITRTLRCDRGCGCERDEDLEVPSFERIGRPQIRYPWGYQLRGGGATVTDFREEYYSRLGKLT